MLSANRNTSTIQERMLPSSWKHPLQSRRKETGTNSSIHMQSRVYMPKTWDVGCLCLVIPRKQCFKAEKSWIASCKWHLGIYKNVTANKNTQVLLRAILCLKCNFLFLYSVTIVSLNLHYSVNNMSATQEWLYNNITNNSDINFLFDFKLRALLLLILIVK